MVDKVDRIRLGMFGVDLQGADPGGIVDGRILEASDLLPGLAGKGQKLHVDLDVMPWHLLLVALGMHGAGSIGSGEQAETMAAESAVDACVGDGDGVVARQVPNDADRPEMVGLAQMKDLLDDRRRGAIGRVLWHGLFVHQALFALSAQRVFRAIETRPADPEVAAGLRNIADGIRVLENPLLALDIAFFFCHRDHPPAGACPS